MFEDGRGFIVDEPRRSWRGRLAASNAATMLRRARRDGIPRGDGIAFVLAMVLVGLAFGAALRGWW